MDQSFHGVVHQAKKWRIHRLSPSRFFIVSSVSRYNVEDKTFFSANILYKQDFGDHISKALAGISNGLTEWSKLGQ